MIEDVYIHTFSVKSVTVSRDDGGAPVETKTYRFEDEPCFVKPISGNEIIEHLKKTLKVRYKLLCDLDLTILITDLVEWNGSEYGVIFIKDHELGDNVHKEVWLEDA